MIAPAASIGDIETSLTKGARQRAMLAEPLDEAWRQAIDDVLASHGWPTLAEAGRLGPTVQRLSQTYNEGRGAALGAMTWGVARALEAAGHEGELDATWVDTDAAALEVARDLVRARARVGPTRVAVRAQIE